jgi:hypothetical protein
MEPTGLPGAAKAAFGVLIWEMTAFYLTGQTTMTLSWIAKQLHTGAVGSLSNLLRKTI